MTFLLRFIIAAMLSLGLLFNASAGVTEIAQAYQLQQSHIQVQGKGEVIRILADDTKGSRHQRFILRLDNQQTLLISHNIDLASRLPQLAIGDQVEFYGEYIWNGKGGLIHWTHHDPNLRHPHGWLKYRGQLYQ